MQALCSRRSSLSYFEKRKREMIPKAGSRKKRAAVQSHSFFLAAGAGTSLLVYWISGGFPPSTWAALWNVLSHMGNLWATSGFALIFPLLVLALQSLLLLLVWGACLGFLAYEVVMLLDALSLWPGLSVRGRGPVPFGTRLRVFPLLRGKQLLMAASAGQMRPALPASASSLHGSSDAPAFPAPAEEKLPEREDLLSNTMSPALPESMRWIFRSLEVLVQSVQKTLTAQALVQEDAAGAERQYSDPLEAPARARAALIGQARYAVEDPLANPFEDAAPAEADPLANPFEDDETFSAPGHSNSMSAEDALKNPFEECEEEEELEQTLPSMRAVSQKQMQAGGLLPDPPEERGESAAGEDLENPTSD